MAASPKWPFQFSGCGVELAKVDQADRGRARVAGAVVAGALDAVGVVAGSLDPPRVRPVPPPRGVVLLLLGAGPEGGPAALLVRSGGRAPGRRPGGGRSGRAA